MALTVSTNAIIEKLTGTAGADSQVHSITSGQIIVCVGGKVVDGGTKQFTVKVMHPGATAAQAAELARPIIKGLLGQAVTAGETAAAQEAEREHLQGTKLFSANQLGRIFTGWAGWLDTLRANKMLEADEERRDEVASAQVKISGANEALKMFRKLPQCKEAEEGHVVTAEVLKVADEMPAFGAASIATSTRIQMFFGALNAVILSERHSAMLEEIAGKDSVSVDEMQTFLARLGESFKVPVTPEPLPSTAFQALMRRVRLGGQADDFRAKAVCLVCESEQQKVALEDHDIFEALLAEWMASGLENFQEASLAALAAGPAMSATDAACFIVRCKSAKQAALARTTQAAQVPTPAAANPPMSIFIRAPVDGAKEEGTEDSATAVAAAAQRIAASREQTGVLNGLARIAELDASPTGLASLTRELDSRGARLPDLVRLVSADAASISNLASTMAADSQFIANVRAIRGACLRRVELLIKGGDLTNRWSDRERKHADRTRCGRFSKVDLAAFVDEDGAASGFSSAAPLDHFAKMDDAVSQLQTALSIFFMIWTRSHTDAGYVSGVAAFGVEVSRFLAEKLCEGASWPEVSRYWRDLMRMCEGQTLRFERREATSLLATPQTAWATDRNNKHVDKLLSSMHKRKLASLEALVAEADAKSKKLADGGDKRKMDQLEKKLKGQAQQLEQLSRAKAAAAAKNQPPIPAKGKGGRGRGRGRGRGGPFDTQYETQAQLTARLGTDATGKEPCWFHHVKGECNPPGGRTCTRYH